MKPTVHAAYPDRSTKYAVRGAECLVQRTKLRVLSNLYKLAKNAVLSVDELSRGAVSLAQSRLQLIDLIHEASDDVSLLINLGLVIVGYASSQFASTSQ